jgi:hypothetical protein
MKINHKTRHLFNPMLSLVFSFFRAVVCRFLGHKCYRNKCVRCQAEFVIPFYWCAPPPPKGAVIVGFIFSDFYKWSTTEMQNVIECYIDKTSLVYGMSEKMRKTFVKERFRDELIAICHIIEDELHIQLSKNTAVNSLTTKTNSSDE